MAKKILVPFLSLALAGFLFSCGGGGGSNVGAGGPDVSPDNTSEAVIGSTDAAIVTNQVADSTTNEAVVGTTTASEGVVVEPEVNTTIEGTVDTGTDTGTTTAAGTTDNPGVDVANTVTETTDTETITEDVAAILVTDDTLTVVEEIAGGTATTTEEGTTVSSEEGTTTTADVATETGVVTEDEVAVVAGNEDSGAGSTAEDLANDEAVDQSKLAYELDSSQGKWYEVAEKDLAPGVDVAAIKAQIAELRKEIKATRDSYKELEKAILEAEKEAATNANIPAGLAKKDELPGKSENALKDKDKNAAAAEKLADLKAKKEEAAAKIKVLRKKIADLRSMIGNGGTKTGGIVTYWANQNLFLNIKGGEPGWYRLVIVAKNIGKLPDDYDRFNFSIENDGDQVASISVKASDKAYFRGSAILKLDKMAGTSLNILWKNDAYLKDVYDANVNIKKVALIKIKEPVKKVRTVAKFKGDQYSFTDGRWFFDKHEAYTFWANQVIGYTFKNMEEGQYQVTIVATNHGTLPLPENYKEFKLEVDSEYDSATVAIPASDKGYKKVTFTMNFPAGDTTVYLTWINDSYKKDVYDANIKIKSIKIKKVKQSNLTAYLLKTKPGNRIFVLTAFIVISAVIGGIYMRNRRKESEVL